MDSRSRPVDRGNHVGVQSLPPYRTIQEYGQRLLAAFKERIDGGVRAFVFVVPFVWRPGVTHEAGTVALVSGHINVQGWNPAIGAGSGLATPFFDMGVPYSDTLQDAARAAAPTPLLPMILAAVPREPGLKERSAAILELSGAHGYGHYGVQESLAGRALGMPILSLAIPAVVPYPEAPSLWDNATSSVVGTIINECIHTVAA